jgi:hypothetical protein
MFPSTSLPKDAGEAMASLLNILSLNTNKQADLGDLHSVLKETKPHLVFLQEVCSYNAVFALVASFGYTPTAPTPPPFRAM